MTVISYPHDQALDRTLRPAAATSRTRASHPAVPCPRSPDAPDTRVVEAAQRGDRAALAHLHAYYAPMVHGIALARVPAAEADDLVQEVFVQALRKLDTLRSADAIGPWLATIARNLAARFHRDRKRHNVLPVDVAAPGGEDADDREATRGEALRILAVIRTLPNAYRETLVLRLVEGLSGPEIARRTGLTSGSVRVNLHRGFAKLHALLDEQEREP